MNKWVRCPKCGNEELSTGPAQRDYGSAWFNVECDDCHFEWQEVFVFSHNELWGGQRLDDNEDREDE